MESLFILRIDLHSLILNSNCRSSLSFVFCLIATSLCFLVGRNLKVTHAQQMAYKVILVLMSDLKPKVSAIWFYPLGIQSTRRIIIDQASLPETVTALGFQPLI